MMGNFFRSSSKERKAFENFEQHLRWVQTVTPVNLEESEADRDKRKAKARKDYSYFVSEYLSHYATVDCAKFQIEFAKTVLKYPILRAIAVWSRFFGKSVHLTIFIPMWLKIQQPRGYNVMLLISKSFDAAKKLLGDLQAELQGNNKYIQDFGVQMKMGSWEDGDFTTKDGCRHFALGLGMSPRGLREKQWRPDLIVPDDIDDDQTVLNEALVDKRIDWFFRALIPAMDVGRGRVLIANNLISEKSITAKLKKRFEKNIKELKQLGQDLNNPSSTKYFISQVPFRDKNGNMTFPGRFTEEEARNLEMELGYAAAQTELYHNPVIEGKIFERDWFQTKNLVPLRSYSDLVAYYDGGYKDTSTSDSKSLVLMGLRNGEYHIIKTYTGKATRMEAVDWHYELYGWLKSRSATCRWYMEEVFMLDLLYDDFKAAAKEKGFPIPLMGDKRKKPDKDLRIQSMAGAFQRGSVFLNQAEEHNHHMKNLVEQFLAFQPGKKTLKDGPDAVEGAMHLLRERVITTDEPVIGRRGGSTGGQNRYRY